MKSKKKKTDLFLFAKSHITLRLLNTATTREHLKKRPSWIILSINPFLQTLKESARASLVQTPLGGAPSLQKAHNDWKAWRHGHPALPQLLRDSFVVRSARPYNFTLSLWPCSVYIFSSFV